MPTSNPIASAAWCERHRRRLLMALLAVSLGLRVWLAATGGQGYWPDEMRYSSASREAAWQFTHGTARDGWLALIGTADHLLFKIVGVPVALWEQLRGHNEALVASWFGLCSVLAIGLVYAIARAVGAVAREALLAAFFAAGASSLFYYCRHFFPYDLSLCLCLLALWLALGPPCGWRSFGAGFAAGLGFLAYNGYWVLGGAVLVLHVVRDGIGLRLVRKAALAGLGLLAPIAVAVCAARLLNRDLVASFREFSRTITQGDFGRGWSLVGEYLWSAEGLVGLGWLGLIAVGLCCGGARRRIVLWLGFAGVLYLGLIVCSDLLRTFVIYGRTARILVPFLCLGAAAGAECIAARWRFRAGWFALLALMTVASGRHMAAALRQVFPEDFLREAKARSQVAKRQSPALLRILNADRLGEGFVASESRPHMILVRRSHPLQFEPFLYEGLGEERRRRFKRTDLSMQLIAVPSVTLPDIGGGYPGPVRMRIKFPANRPGISEPLLTSGEPGRANFVYVHYVDATHVQFGFDAWGLKGVAGEPVAIEPGREYQLVVSSGAQMPPLQNASGGVSAVEWSRLQESVLIVMDGKTALVGRVASNPAEAASLLVGVNAVGGSTAREGFSGEILSVERASGSEVLQRITLFDLQSEELARYVAMASPGPAWQGYCGPLRLQLRFPSGAAGQAEPLVVSGKTGKGDFVYVRYLADGRVSFGFDHWGVGGAESAPVALNESRRAEVVISCGAMMPPRESAIYAANVGLAQLRERVLVMLDGQVVFSTTMASHPTDPAAVVLGRNPIGGSTTMERFTGDILAVDREPIENVLARAQRSGASP